MLSKIFLNLNIFYQLKKLLRNFPFQSHQVESIRLNKLKKLLVHSYNRFDFYRDLFDRAKFDPHVIEHIEDIQRLPIVDKDMYREFSYSLINKNPDPYEKYYKDGTSGSTGKPLTLYRTWGERAYMLAKYLRPIFLNGLRYRDITFSLPSPHRITESDSFLQKFGLLRRKCVAYTEPAEILVQGFQKSRADFLYANTSQLVRMAQYIKENKIQIKKPRLIASSGELLDINSRNLIESVFGYDRIFEVYGAVECGTLAFQMVGDNYFHFNHDTNVIELENKGKIDKARGRCIITDLNIFSFPLIRYKLDDWIEMENRHGQAVITRILGREDDWISFRDGSRIPYHPFYEVMENKSMVRQFRFVQENIDQINLYLIVDQQVNRDELKRQLLSDLKSKIPAVSEYGIIFTDQIPPDPSGKLRMVVSKIEI